MNAACLGDLTKPKDMQAKIQALKLKMNSAPKAHKKQLRQQIEELSCLKAKMLSETRCSMPEAPSNAKARSRNRSRAPEKGFPETPLIWHPKASEEEEKKLGNILCSANLEIQEMPADGHCLFSAISHQFYTRHSKTFSIGELRKMSSSFIQNNADSFLPYFLADDEGVEENTLGSTAYCDVLENLVQHCKRVADTAEWGGEQEIVALSEYHRVPIWVYQASCPVLKIGEKYQSTENTPPLLLS